MVIKITQQTKAPVRSIGNKRAKGRSFADAMDRADGAQHKTISLEDKFFEERSKQNESLQAKKNAAKRNSLSSLAESAKAEIGHAVAADEQTSPVDESRDKPSALEVMALESGMRSSKKRSEQEQEKIDASASVHVRLDARTDLNESQKAQPQSFGSTQPATQLQELANLVDRLQSTHKNADGKWIISLCDSAHGFEKLILQKTAENQWSVLVTVRADVQANLAQQDLQRLRLELQRRGHNARVESTTDKEEQA